MSQSATLTTLATINENLNDGPDIALRGILSCTDARRWVRDQGTTDPQELWDKADEPSYMAYVMDRWSVIANRDPNGLTTMDNRRANLRILRCLAEKVEAKEHVLYLLTNLLHARDEELVTMAANIYDIRRYWTWLDEDRTSTYISGQIMHYVGEILGGQILPMISRGTYWFGQALEDKHREAGQGSIGGTMARSLANQDQCDAIRTGYPIVPAYSDLRFSSAVYQAYADLEDEDEDLDDDEEDNDCDADSPICEDHDCEVCYGPQPCTPESPRCKVETCVVCYGPQPCTPYSPHCGNDDCPVCNGPFEDAGASPEPEVAPLTQAEADAVYQEDTSGAVATAPEPSAILAPAFTARLLASLPTVPSPITQEDIEAIRNAPVPYPHPDLPIQHVLRGIGACLDARIWVRRQRTGNTQTLWDNCDNLGFMMTALSHTYWRKQERPNTIYSNKEALLLLKLSHLVPGTAPQAFTNMLYRLVMTPTADWPSTMDNLLLWFWPMDALHDDRRDTYLSLVQGVVSREWTMLSRGIYDMYSWIRTDIGDIDRAHTMIINALRATFPEPPRLSEIVTTHDVDNDDNQGLTGQDGCTCDQCEALRTEEQALRATIS